MKSQWKFIGLMFLLASTACSQTNTYSSSGNAFQDSQNTITQTKSAFLDDGVIKIGIVSDIEGAIESSKAIAEKFKGQNLDAIIIAGDTYENELIRRNPVYDKSTDNLKEMVDGTSPYAVIGVPVFIIPGNHETKTVYQEGINQLRKKHSTVFDMTATAVDAQGVNLVGIGGYHDRDFIAPGGFQISGEDYGRAKRAIAEFTLQDEMILLVTHSPPLTNSQIDRIVGGGNVGDPKINELLNSSKVINIHGHIHEGGGNAVSVGNSTAINVASITGYNSPDAPRGVVLTISKGTVKYEFLN